MRDLQEIRCFPGDRNVATPLKRILSRNFDKNPAFDLTILIIKYNTFIEIEYELKHKSHAQHETKQEQSGQSHDNQ